MRSPALDGLQIVVCRPRHQAAGLAEALENEGAIAVMAPVIEIVDPADGGRELEAAIAELAPGDWLVVTSPNGAERAGAYSELCDPGVRVAAIGPKTASVAEAAGLAPALVADVSIAEGLLEVFPDPSDGAGPRPRVVLARAETARAVLPDGLRARGWLVDDVAAYRTIASPLDVETQRRARAADGVVFTSSSTVDALVDALGVEAIPPLVASIGPATTATARGHGLDVVVQAARHTIDGLLEALCEHGRDLLSSGAP